jgi:hypothetical protein
MRPPTQLNVVPVAGSIGKEPFSDEGDDRLDRGGLREHGLPARSEVEGDHVQRNPAPPVDTALNRH